MRSQLLFNEYMDGAVGEVNARVLGKELELLCMKGCRLSKRALLADDTVIQH